MMSPVWNSAGGERLKSVLESATRQENLDRASERWSANSSQVASRSGDGGGGSKATSRVRRIVYWKRKGKSSSGKFLERTDGTSDGNGKGSPKSGPAYPREGFFERRWREKIWAALIFHEHKTWQNEDVDWDSSIIPLTKRTKCWGIEEMLNIWDRPTQIAHTPAQFFWRAGQV